MECQAPEMDCQATAVATGQSVNLGPDELPLDDVLLDEFSIKKEDSLSIGELNEEDEIDPGYHYLPSPLIDIEDFKDYPIYEYLTQEDLQVVADWSNFDSIDPIDF